MIKRNRYRTMPKEKKKRPRRSRPLKRSVHIDGKRWGWEVDGHFDDNVGSWKTEVKILSPENQYTVVNKGELSHGAVGPGMVKKHILENLCPVQ